MCVMEVYLGREQRVNHKGLYKPGVGYKQRLGIAQHVIDMDLNMDWCLHVGSYL